MEWASRRRSPFFKADILLSGAFAMTIADYKTVLYRQEDSSWVAEIPALPGC